MIIIIIIIIIMGGVRAFSYTKNEQKKQNAKPYSRMSDSLLALPETITFFTIYDFSRSHKTWGKSIRSKKNPFFLFLICRDRTERTTKSIHREEGIDLSNK